MKRFIVALICVGMCAMVSPLRAAEAGAEKIISKSFNVEAGGELNVEADQGDIEVVSGNQSTVDVVVERSVPGATEAQTARILKAHTVTFSQDDKRVRVEAKTAKVSHGLFSSAHPNLQIHIRVTVPRRFNATLNTAGGNVHVTDLVGTVDARTSGGDLSLTKIDGPAEGHTSGGNVKAVACKDKLTIQTSGGNIVINDFTGPTAQADTSGGNIDVAGCAGKLQVKTSGGNIHIDKFSGPAAYGDTSGGTVSVVFEKTPTGDCWFNTSGGNVTARLPDDSAVNLHARTEGGAVSSALPVTVVGKQKEGVLEGKINGGGPNLALKSSGGNIRLEKL